MCSYLAKVEKEKSQPKTFYVDASGQIAGRLCSKVAKLLLVGNSVVVVNADKALFSGAEVKCYGRLF